MFVVLLRPDFFVAGANYRNINDEQEKTIKFLNIVGH